MDYEEEQEEERTWEMVCEFLEVFCEEFHKQPTKLMAEDLYSLLLYKRIVFPVEFKLSKYFFEEESIRALDLFPSFFDQVPLEEIQLFFYIHFFFHGNRRIVIYQ